MVRAATKYRCPPLAELARQLLFAPPAKRAELEQTYAEASALWRSVEQPAPDLKAFRLSEAQIAQFNKGLADVTAAMSRLSEALRGADDAALLKALVAVKPPFARTFTAFGRYN